MVNPSDVRDLFPVMRQRAYIFSGGIAPHSTRSLAAVDRFNDLLANDPGELYRRYREEFIVVRKLFADLVGADVDEVAVTDCTGTGSNLAVEMIEPVPGSNVVFDESAYPCRLPVDAASQVACRDPICWWTRRDHPLGRHG
jgi:hypothetical protein